MVHDLDPSPNAAADRALVLAAGHVNVSLTTAMPPARLLRVLQTGTVPDRFAHHVHAVLDETDLETLTDLVLSGAVTDGHLGTLADRLLPANHTTRAWLNGRRGF